VEAADLLPLPNWNWGSWLSRPRDLKETLFVEYPLVRFMEGRKKVDLFRL
jgi:hypothetical protein